MRDNYKLNDMVFENVPLVVIEPSDIEIDKEELRKSIEKNRRLIEDMRNDENYKRIMAM